MAGCKPTPEFEDAIRKMARNRYANGITNRAHIIDSIHEAVGDIGAWRNEIGDIVHAEVGEQITLAEAQSRLSNTRNELRKLANTQQNATRRAQLERDMADLKRRIETGDYAKKKRTRYQYSDETMALMAERERLKQHLDHDIQRMSEARRSTAYKAMRETARVMRAGILTSPTVFEHLLGASGWRALSTVLEDAVGAGINRLPGVRDIAALAPVEGGGFNAMAQWKGLRGAFSKETLKAMKDKIVKGASDRQALYGDGHVSSNAYERALNLPGSSHDAIKTAVEQYAYYRAAERQASNMRRELLKSHSAEEVDKIMSADSITAAINARAYAESKAAKLQGDNKVVDAYNQMLAKAEKSGDLGAAVATLLRFETPIVRIPANYAAEAGSYIGGALKARSRFNAAKLEGRITPDDADYIIRNLKKQTVGAGAMALGWLYYEHLGGLYRPMKGDANKEVPVGDAKVGDTEISHHLLHSPFVGVMQAAALAHFVYDEDLKKSKEKGASGALKAFGTGVGSGLAAIAQSIPVFNIANDVQKIGQGQFGRWAGDKVAQATIPGAVQWYARAQDVDEQGRPIKRVRKTFSDEIKEALPGYREELPRR